TELLSPELAGVPQFGELSVHFGRHEIYRASEFERRRSDGEPYVVLSAQFIRREASASAPRKLTDFYQPHWEIAVYAVPSTRKKSSQTLIAQIALPKIRQWLSSAAPDTQFMRRFEALFSEPENSLSFREVN